MIPQPHNLKIEDGKFILNSNTKIYASDNLLAVSKYLKELIMKPTGIMLEDTSEKMVINSVNLELDESLKDLSPEGYLLDISPDFIHIRAPQLQ